MKSQNVLKLQTVISHMHQMAYYDSRIAIGHNLDQWIWEGDDWQKLFNPGNLVIDHPW